MVGNHVQPARNTETEAAAFLFSEAVIDSASPWQIFSPSSPRLGTTVSQPGKSRSRLHVPRGIRFSIVAEQQAIPSVPPSGI
jgi:hypothetical protein